MNDQTEPFHAKAHCAKRVCNALEWFKHARSLIAAARSTRVNAIETGAMVPSTVLALKLGRALGVSVEELFTLVDAPA